MPTKKKTRLERKGIDGKYAVETDRPARPWARRRGGDGRRDNGGARPGAGRPKGSKGNLGALPWGSSTLLHEVRHARRVAEESGQIDPLAEEAIGVLLGVMRNPNQDNAKERIQAATAVLKFKRGDKVDLGPNLVDLLKASGQTEDDEENPE